MVLAVLCWIMINPGNCPYSHFLQVLNRGNNREITNTMQQLFWRRTKYRNTLNKRPMGHIAHLRKHFKSINTFDYIITLIKRKKKSLLSLWEFIGSSAWEFIGSSLNEETWIPFTQVCFVPRLFEIGSVVQRIF